MPRGMRAQAENFGAEMIDDDITASAPAYHSHPKIQPPIPHRIAATAQYWTGTE